MSAAESSFVFVESSFVSASMNERGEKIVRNQIIAVIKSFSSSRLPSLVKVPSACYTEAKAEG
jgi:hypothetical protein